MAGQLLCNLHPRWLTGKTFARSQSYRRRCKCTVRKDPALLCGAEGILNTLDWIARLHADFNAPEVVPWRLRLGRSTLEVM